MYEGSIRIVRTVVIMRRPENYRAESHDVHDEHRGRQTRQGGEKKMRGRARSHASPTIACAVHTSGDV
jgi:hypothetical protein